MNTDKNKISVENKITEDDLQAIGKMQRNLRSDGGEDSMLKDRDQKVDFEGKDLDVPGRKLSNSRAHKLLKDEENQLYSQGSEENEKLEMTTEYIS